MSEFGMALVAIFSGVLGAVVGFFVIAAAAVILALPYFLMNRSSENPHPESEEETRAARYS